MGARVWGGNVGVDDPHDKAIYIGDNLHVMRGLDNNLVDLIYLDPPFNSNRNYGEFFDGEEQKAIFKDIWTLQEVDLAWWASIRERNKDLYKFLEAVRGWQVTYQYSKGSDRALGVGKYANQPRHRVAPYRQDLLS